MTDIPRTTFAMGIGDKVPVAEIAKHSSAEDCWVVVNGKVYDLSKVRTSLSSGNGGIEQTDLDSSHQNTREALR